MFRIACLERRHQSVPGGGVLRAAKQRPLHRGMPPIVRVWQMLQRRGDRLATEHQLVASDHPVDRGVASGALPELAALGFIALMAMALLFVGHNSQGHVTATDEPNSAVQVQTGGMAADPTPAKPRANPAEHSNPPTSASTPPQPGSTPTTETGVGTTVNRPAGNDDQKR